MSNQIWSLYRNWLRNIKLLHAPLGLPFYPRHNPSFVSGISYLTSSSVFAHPLQVKESFATFVFINLPHAYLISSFFSTWLTSSLSRPTKKLKMAKEKNIASNSRSKKSKLLEDVRNPSTLQRFSRRPAHQFDFSNTIDNPIEVEEVEDPSERSEDDSTFREASSEEDSMDIISALGKTKMT